MPRTALLHCEMGVHGRPPSSCSRDAHQKNEEIVALSEDEPPRTVLRYGFEGAHKVMTEAVVGSSPRLFPMGADGQYRDQSRC